MRFIKKIIEFFVAIIVFFVTIIAKFLKALKSDMDEIPYKHRHKPDVAYKGSKWATMHYKDRPMRVKRTSPEGIKVEFIKRKQPMDLKYERRVVVPGEVRYHYDTRVGLQVVMAHRKNDTFLAKNRNGVRDDNRRRTVKTWIKPAENKAHDRTHVRPWGYHGFEDDPVLVVGWNSEQNRNDLANFENKINALNRNQPIVWVTVIKPTRYGAVWIYEVYDRSGKHLIDSLKLFYGDKNHPKSMYWLRNQEDGFNKYPK